MTKLTDPGATTMWDGWFTTYWRLILTGMISRDRENKHGGEHKRTTVEYTARETNG